MWYIHPEPNPGGAYPAPQSSPFPGSLELTDGQAQTVLASHGFVTLSVEGDAVAAVETNLAALTAWRSSLPADTGESEPPADPIAALAEENKALRAQVSALTQSTQFLEDCLAEMAGAVYA